MKQDTIITKTGIKVTKPDLVQNFLFQIMTTDNAETKNEFSDETQQILYKYDPVPVKAKELKNIIIETDEFSI